jgi:hypothetical protein
MNGAAIAREKDTFSSLLCYVYVLQQYLPLFCREVLSHIIEDKPPFLTLKGVNVIYH